jgi:hypothetical protein
MEQLRSGATIVVDAIDEMSASIGTLAERLEWDLRENIQVNAYAGWRTARGFDVHWDDHDVIILQVAGHKDWKIFGSTRNSPLYRDVEAAEKPSTPIWEETLGPGDFLYIPRGWWHVATPKNEPSLHLTFGISNCTGLDYFGWILDRLRAHDAFRQDVPRFRSEAELFEHQQVLHDLARSELSRSDLAAFLAERDAQARPAIRLDLPFIDPGDGLDQNTAIRFNGKRPATLQASATPGTVEFAFSGKVWRFSDIVMPVLKVLLQPNTCTIDDLMTAPGNTLDNADVTALVVELRNAGIISIVA